MFFRMPQPTQHMSTSIHPCDRRRHLPAMIAGLATMALALPSYSQGPPIALPGAGQAAAQALENATEDLKKSANSSRFIEPDNRPGFVTEKLAVLSMTSREYDPFGQVQDPEAKPAVVKPTVTRRPTTLKRTSYAEIIQRIKINTVIPADKRFLIGTRSFKLGDEIPIMYRGRKTMIEVVKVKSSSVDFKNTETGEVASVKLKLMPAGMSSGKDGFKAPGMVKDNDNAPLQLDSGF